MRAGTLRHRITLQTATAAADSSYGQPVQTWADTDEVWAAIEPIAGNERFRAQAERADLTHVVTIRYRAGTGPLMRVKFGTRVFDVLSQVNDRERDERLQLLCREQVTS